MMDERRNTHTHTHHTYRNTYTKLLPATSAKITHWKALQGSTPRTSGRDSFGRVFFAPGSPKNALFALTENGRRVEVAEVSDLSECAGYGES